MHKQTKETDRRDREILPFGTNPQAGQAPPGNGRQGGEFLSLAEAGQLLGVGRCRAWELARAGLLPAIRLGRRWFVPRRALDVLVDRALARSQEALAAQEGR